MSIFTTKQSTNDSSKFITFRLKITIYTNNNNVDYKFISDT